MLRVRAGFRLPSQYSVELWDANNSLALAVPQSSSSISMDLEKEFKQCNSHSFRTVGTIRVVNDTVAYPAETLTSTIQEGLNKSAHKELSLV